MKESEIKDYLARNLHVLSSELVLVKTEYKLENNAGTDGFIDILARDIYDNYVIIEIKQSKQSSRSAIHEIMKYVSLLKSTLHLKDCEIRAIIISTEWDELKTSFFDWKKRVDLAIEGYQFTSERKCVEILDEVRDRPVRELSRNQLAFLYKSIDEFERYKEKLVNIIQKCKLQDFFLLELRNEGNISVVFPFALILVIQRCPEDEYISILTNSDWDEEWDEQEIYDYGLEGEELLVFLEEGIYTEIISYHLFNDVEICSPETIVSMVAQQGWLPIGVTKSGYFIHENRPDDWFFRKAAGVEENDNNYIFENFCDTKFELKFTEMLNGAREFMQYKDDMLSCFDEVWNDIEQRKVKRTTIQIYNSGNIIQNLIMYENNGNIEELPYADIFLEYKDGAVDRYIILLAYGQDEIKPQCFILDNLLKGNGQVYMQMLWSGEIVIYNDEIMKNLGLTYDWMKYSYENGGWKLRRMFKKTKFLTFYREHIYKIKKMQQWYREHIVY